MTLVLAAVGFGVVTAAILALAGVGFTLQFGVTNVLNLAYGSVMTASAFVAYLTTELGLNPWLGLLAGGVFGAVFSLLLNRVVYAQFIHRGTRLFGMIIVSISMGLVVQYALQAIFGASFFSLRGLRGRAINFGPFAFTDTQLEILGLGLLAMVGIHLLLRYTTLGKAMRATATNPELARNCGIATDRVVDLAWSLSGLLCGLAGVGLVMVVPAFTDTTGGDFLIPIIAVAVLGGIGHPYGAMVGALVVGVASAVAAAVISPDYNDVVAFVILIAVLLIRPKGIFTEVATGKEVVA
ncbi:MAG: branched-chain amino acid ABC transporter permease [Candidatus Dormibacteria bacterium]